METNIPKTAQKRVVVVGAGFGGLKVAKSLRDSGFQVVMVDRDNYHQFQPLIYQVATSALEASSVAFPVRKDFQCARDFYFRLAEFKSVDVAGNAIETSIGRFDYHYLVLAMGTTTNYYGMANIERAALPMKSVSEALALRNHLLQMLECSTVDPSDDKFRTVVIVGAGATGVEIAGALADMRRYIIPKDYPELSESPIRIVLIEASSKVLGSMHAELSDKALSTLQGMGVEVMLNTSVVDYIDHQVVMGNGEKIATRTLVWVSGVTARRIEGLPDAVFGRGGRVVVDEFNRVEGCSNIFVIGDAAFQKSEKYPNGYPQVAPVPIGQGANLVRNLARIELGTPLKPFEYKDMGSMATIGRAKAVVDLGGVRFSGWFAWVTWLLVHLMSILGTKNKIVTLFNWFWSYVTFDQSLRLIIRHNKEREG